MVNILVIAILLIPWLIVPINGIPEPTRLIKGAFFDFTMMGIICMALTNGLKFEYKNKYLAWASLWVFITIAFNWYYPLVRGFGYNAGTIDASVHFILFIIGTFLICSNFERVDFIRCGKAICISSTLVSIFCLFQAIGLDPMKHIATYSNKETRHIAALLDHPDLVGNYIALSLPLFLYFNKPKYIISLGLCVITILLTKSSLSILGGFIGVFVFLLFRYYRNRIVLYLTSVFSLSFLAFCFLNNSFNKFSGGFTGRIEAWKEIFHKIDNPLFGQGLGVVKAFNILLGGVKENYWMFAHNDYLEIFCSLGGLGLFLFFLVIVNSIRRFNFKEDNKIGFAFYGSLFSFLIIMFGSFPMEFPPLALSGLLIFCAVEKT